MIKKLWRLETGIFLGTWLFLMIGGRSSMFFDAGTFWHIVVGERILSTGKFIHTDTFSFTYAGHHWIAQEWLGECIMALVHRIAGFDGLLLAAVTMLAFFYTWLAHRLLRAGIHPFLAILFMMSTILGSLNQFLIRPLLATIVFLGVTVAMLANVEKGRASFRSLFWLAPVFVLWANLHGGYLGGMGTLLIVTGGWIILWFAGLDGPISGNRQVLALVALAILCGLAALVNPYGVELPKAWYAIMSSRLVPKVIVEQMPLWDFKYPMIFELPAFLFYLSALADVYPMRPRITWLVPFVWLGLGIARCRFAPLFATVSLVILPDMLPHVYWFRRFSQDGCEICEIREQGKSAGALRPTYFIIPAMVVVLVLTLQVVGVRASLFGRGWAEINPAFWPVGMLGELKTIESKGPVGTKIFNPMLYGGFLIYYTPRLRVFIDDRCELYKDEGLSADLDLMEKKPAGIERLASEYGFKYALVQIPSRMDRYLSQSKNWLLLKKINQAALFEQLKDVQCISPLPGDSREEGQAGR